MIAIHIPRRASVFSALFLTIVAALLPALVPGQASAHDWAGEKITGSGVPKTETRSISGFHSIALGVHAKLELRQGATEGVTITGDDNIVPLVETRVDNGALKINWLNDRDYSTQYKELTIIVDAKMVDGLSIGGSGQAHAAQLKTDNLRVRIGGSGSVAIDQLDADSTSVNIGGSGRFAAAGRADSLEATLGGSGVLTAAKLATRDARLTVAGSGHATVWAKDNLSARIAGSGGVKYYGTPKISKSVAGSGSVVQASDSQ
jgi:hypothetical protein